MVYKRSNPWLHDIDTHTSPSTCKGHTEELERWSTLMVLRLLDLLEHRTRQAEERRRIHQFGTSLNCFAGCPGATARQLLLAGFIWFTSLRAFAYGRREHTVSGALMLEAGEVAWIGPPVPLGAAPRARFMVYATPDDSILFPTCDGVSNDEDHTHLECLFE